MKRILVFNAGSSSLKFKLFTIDDKGNTAVEKKGAITKIGTPEGPKNHTMALSILFEGFGRKTGYLNKIDNLVAIGHRVVHGGSEFRQTQLIDETVINKLEEYNDLAPLHNPPIIEVIKQVYANSGINGHRLIPNYAVFDTAYYANLPDVTNIYPLPLRYYSEEKIERFGFHGLSHKNALLTAQQMFGNDFKTLISVHLGAGCSVTAVKDLQPIDTSMGYTPNEGLMMATRSGSIDPGLVLYLMKKENLSADQMIDLLNSQSGLLGISEVSSDMKDLLYLAGLQVEDPDYQVPGRIANLPEIYQKKARLAIEMFVYRIKKNIGAYNAILGSTDILVFTGSIGSGSSLLRKMIVENLDHVLGDSNIISVKTDEELQIAKEIIPLFDSEI